MIGVQVVFIAVLLIEATRVGRWISGMTSLNIAVRVEIAGIGRVFGAFRVAHIDVIASCDAEELTRVDGRRYLAMLLRMTIGR